MGRAVNRIREAAGLPDETDENRLAEAAALLSAETRLSQVQGSNLLRIAVGAPDAELARLRVDSIVAAYQQFLRSQKLVATQDAIDAIDQRISESSQPALTSTRLKIVVDQLATSDLGRVDLAIDSSISQIEALDLSQFAETPSLGGLISELEAAAARLDTVSGGLASLKNELGTSAGAAGSDLQSVETVQGLVASSLVTVRQVRGDFAEASITTDLSTGVASLTNSNISMSAAGNQLATLSTNLAIPLEDRNELVQLRDQVQALQGSNTSVSNQVTAQLNAGQGTAEDRQRLVTQFDAAASSLRITLTSLTEIRQTVTNTTALTQMVTVEGLINAVISELTAASAELTDGTAAAPLAELDQLENLLVGTVERLDLIRVRLGGSTGGDQLLEAEVQSVATILQSASASTATLRINPQLRIVASSADLFSLEPQLNTGVNLMNGIAANLAAGSSLSNDVLADRVDSWQETVSAARAETNTLESTLADLDTSGPADPILLALDEAAAHLRDQAISMVSIGQIIDATANAGVSGFIAGRLNRFSDDLSVASGIFSTSADRMTSTATSIRDMPLVIIDASLDDLQTASTELDMATEIVETLRATGSSGELLTLSDAGELAARLQLVESTLSKVAVEIASIGAAELDLTAQNVQTAGARLGTVLAQISGVEAAETAAVNDLFQVRRELQISVLGPQETGVSLVDTEVNEFSSTDGSSFPIDARVIAGGVLGLLLGVIGALVLELMDRKVRRPEDIGDIAHVPSLGLLPQGLAKGNPHPPEVTDDPTSVFSEAVHLVATHIQGRVNEQSRLLLISSPAPREGKTMMAINLARALSLRSLKVLLVDANFRKPDASKILGFEDEPGLATALTQSTDPEQFIKTVEDSDLQILPAGRSLVPPVELISRPATGELLQKVRQQYDFVIIDGPPILGFSESNALAKQAGAVIMVARAGQTKKSDLREAMGNLSGSEVLGVVMNMVRPKDLAFLEHSAYSGRGGRGTWRSRLLRPFPFSKN